MIFVRTILRFSNSTKKVIDQKLRQARGWKLFPIFQAIMWFVFTPEVFLRVDGADYFLEETEELGVNLKESMLALDWAILDCSISLFCLSLFSCMDYSLLMRNLTLLRSSFIYISYSQRISEQAFSHFQLDCLIDSPWLMRCVRISNQRVRLLMSSSLSLRVSFSFFIQPSQKPSISFTIQAQLQSFFSRASFSFRSRFSRYCHWRLCSAWAASFFIIYIYLAWRWVVRSLRFLSSAILYFRSFTFSCKFLLLAYSCCFSACRESTCALSSSTSLTGGGQSSLTCAMISSSFLRLRSLNWNSSSSERRYWFSACSRRERALWSMPSSMAVASNTG